MRSWIATSSCAMQVSTACGRTLTTCEDLFVQHKAFLSSISSQNAEIMWQYFLSGASAVLSQPEAASSPSGRALALQSLSATRLEGQPSLTNGGAKRTPGRKGRLSEQEVLPNGGAGRRTPRRPQGDLVRTDRICCRPV